MSDFRLSFWKKFNSPSEPAKEDDSEEEEEDDEEDDDDNDDEEVRATSSLEGRGGGGECSRGAVGIIWPKVDDVEAGFESELEVEAVEEVDVDVVAVTAGAL